MGVLISFCEECREKANGARIMTPITAGRYGYCQGCFRHRAVIQYELGPTWQEAERKRRRERMEERKGRKAGERRRP